MQWRELPYREYLGQNYQYQNEIRRFGNCVVMRAVTLNGTPVILLEEPWQRVTICEYGDAAEWEEDVKYLRSLPPGSGGSPPATTGVPVPRPPHVPIRRSGADALPLPAEPF